MPFAKIQSQFFSRQGLHAPKVRDEIRLDKLTSLNMKSPLPDKGCRTPYKIFRVANVSCSACLSRTLTIN